MDQKAVNKLKSIVERIEKLEEERKGLGEEISEILEAAKSGGYSTKAIKDVIKLRKQEREERVEHETIRELYCRALGVELAA